MRSERAGRTDDFGNQSIRLRRAATRAAFAERLRSRGKLRPGAARSAADRVAGVLRNKPGKLSPEHSHHELRSLFFQFPEGLLLLSSLPVIPSL